MLHWRAWPTVFFLRWHSFTFLTHTHTTALLFIINAWVKVSFGVLFVTHIHVTCHQWGFFFIFSMMSREPSSTLEPIVDKGVMAARVSVSLCVMFIWHKGFFPVNFPLTADHFSTLTWPSMLKSPKEKWSVLVLESFMSLWKFHLTKPLSPALSSVRWFVSNNDFVLVHLTPQ